MMNAAVCVVVTVPTAEEEHRVYNKCCRCGCCGSTYTRSEFWKTYSRDFYNNDINSDDHLGSLELCDRCWRLAQTARSEIEQQHPPNNVSAKSRALQLNELKEDTPVEVLLHCIAEQLRLKDVFWSQDVAGKQLQVRFELLQDERYERLLCTLQDWGVGERPGTHVSAIHCLDTRASHTSSQKMSGGQQGAFRQAKLQGQMTGDRGDLQYREEEEEVECQHGQGWQSFMDSVRCRLNVNQVVRQVRRDATLTFDFVVLLTAAALLSCVGLVENSFLFLSSSMLISPLMGPIIAGIFGSVIGDRDLRWLGIKNELIGIAISVVIGFMFGGIVCGFGHFFAISAGLTEEIVSRCDTHSLAIGICTALASGAAGAIAVLGGNTGSLVGVAISASLLPPAVNAGLLWALALGTQLLHSDHEILRSLAHHKEYSKHLHIELFVCAAVSMGLTLLNVVCVWLMGVVVLRIKEVAPAVQRNQQFWRHDIRLAREVALHDPALQVAIDRLQDEQISQHSQMDVEAPRYQNTWSPGMHDSSLDHLDSQEAARGASKVDPNANYHTVHGFQEFCITLHRMNKEGCAKKVPASTHPNVRHIFGSMDGLSSRQHPMPISGGATDADASSSHSTTTTTPTGDSDFSNYLSLTDITSLRKLWLTASQTHLIDKPLPRQDESHVEVDTKCHCQGVVGEKPIGVVRKFDQHPQMRQLSVSLTTLNQQSPTEISEFVKRCPGQVLLPLPSADHLTTATTAPNRRLRVVPHKNTEQEQTIPKRNEREEELDEFNV